MPEAGAKNPNSLKILRPYSTKLPSSGSKSRGRYAEAIKGIRAIRAVRVGKKLEVTFIGHFALCDTGDNVLRDKGEARVAHS
ncbi:hypothetical protein M0R45_009439 [Rubus argutus]|uniref:Uncharacterized protein n=1 Tax=Rubus argutus TaxID=59490 RepID=A0AAW1Y6J4_RUBAR